jgi:predicted secreted protein
MSYRLPINNSWVGKDIVLRDFPDLDMVYVSAQNNLCRSYYDPNVKCPSPGYLQATININGQNVTLRSDSDEVKRINGYTLQATGPIVIDNDPNQTYIGVDINVLDTRTVRLGESFTLVRTSNAGTGYQWVVTPSKGIKFVSTSVRIRSGIPGSPSDQVWTFEATEPGQQEIQLVYKRPWIESPEDITETVYVNVV